jgi:hypothetical protein
MKFDAGNPTGYDVVFIDSQRRGLCYATPQRARCFRTSSCVRAAKNNTAETIAKELLCRHSTEWTSRRDGGSNRIGVGS